MQSAARLQACKSKNYTVRCCAGASAMPDFLAVIHRALATTATPRASRLFLVKAGTYAPAALQHRNCTSYMSSKSFQRRMLTELLAFAGHTACGPAPHGWRGTGEHAHNVVPSRMRLDVLMIVYSGFQFVNRIMSILQKPAEERLPSVFGRFGAKLFGPMIDAVIGDVDASKDGVGSHLRIR